MRGKQIYETVPDVHRLFGNNSVSDDDQAATTLPENPGPLRKTSVHITEIPVRGCIAPSEFVVAPDFPIPRKLDAPIASDPM